MDPSGIRIGGRGSEESLEPAIGVRRISGVGHRQRRGKREEREKIGDGDRSGGEEGLEGERLFREEMEVVAEEERVDRVCSGDEEWDELSYLVVMVISEEERL